MLYITAPVRWVQRPLYTVGDAHQTTADVAVDEHLVNTTYQLVVSDELISADVIVGRSWLQLPHVNFYKLRDQFIFGTFNSIDPSVPQENDDEGQPEAEFEDEDAMQGEVRVVRHEVEKEDRDYTTRPTQTMRSFAQMFDYQLN